MVRTSPPAHSRQHDTSRSACRIALPAALLASLLWHLFLFNWANGRITVPAPRDDAPAVMMTELRPLPAAAASEPPPVSAPKPKRKPRPRPVAPPPPQAETVVAAAAAPEPPAPIPEPIPEPIPADPEPPAPVAEAEPPPAVAENTTKFSAPPSAELKYEVQALRDGQQWHGTGMFQWNAGAGSYVINGEASITLLFKITVLNFRSEGEVSAAGIAPVLYSEKPWRKAMTNTHFRRDDRKISFSASESIYPYTGGEQDRASIMWQLAGIGRGDPGQFSPGTAFDIMVAGARNAEVWRIDVIGEEEIDTPFGKMAAWHVRRAPKAGSYDQKIDIWLAAGHEWYPAKVRFTYANGDYLDMLLSDLAPLGSAHAFSGNE